MKDRDGFRRMLDGLTRRDFMVAGTGLVIGAALPVIGCGDDAQPAPVKDDDPAAKGTPWAGTEEVLDLRESLHLADLDCHGEFVDFGTAARFKYTLGGWMTGFDNDTSINGISFTWATKSPSRLYFSVPDKTPLTFEFRAKKGGTDGFSVYLNDNPLTRVNLKGDGWGNYRVKADPEAVLAGENYLKLIYSTAEKKIGGSNASFALDYLRIIPESVRQPEEFDPPHLDRLRQRYAAGDRERDVLMLTSPITLSYYADIPSGAKLCASVAAVSDGNKGKPPQMGFSVRAVSADGKVAKGLLKRTYEDGNWHDEMVGLDAVAGKLARVDISVDGPPGTRLAVGDPAIRLVPPRIEPVSSKVKNIVVLLIDTLRADKLSVYGKTRVKSPVFEKFAAESVVFDRCQANSNWTKPSCATVLTGLHPDSHKARGHSSKLVSSVKMASEIFRSAGYATGAFIANGYLAAEFGFNRGWNTYVNYIRETKNTDAENVYKDTLKFIGDNKGKPFFTYIQTIDPHVPYDPPPEDLKIYDAQAYEGPVSPRSTGNLLEKFKRKRVDLSARDRRRLESLYDGEVTYHDRHFGHFLDGLHKAGVLDDTMIVVCADHGEEFFEHDSVGHGHSLHQELLHVPLAIRAPRLVPRNKRCGLDVTLAKGMEGLDLLPAARGAALDPVAAAFSSFWSEADDRNLSWTVRKGDWKLRMRGPVRTYVYNLKDDPKERTDVDERYPIALRALRILLGQFIGSPNKHRWSSGDVAAQVVGRPEADEESTEVPEDLKQQLRELGYMQ
ncbi:MAG: sulfatase [Deltaproteobacteria bacterium]|nr:sulfatase [Deltaproteobacteria bacterium]